jgi:hypothetical protein
LATFEMKANGEVFQLQNGVSHAMFPSLTRMTGRKAPQQRRFLARRVLYSRQIVRPCQGQNVLAHGSTHHRAEHRSLVPN